jgi:hypothetical protein
MDSAVYNATRDGLQIPGSLKMDTIEQTSNGRNDELLEEYLASPHLEIDLPRVQKLEQRIQAAIRDNDQMDALEFLKYVGRKFALKAQRAPENREALLRRQMTRQRNFLRKIKSRIQSHV